MMVLPSRFVPEQRHAAINPKRMVWSLKGYQFPWTGTPYSVPSPMWPTNNTIDETVLSIRDKTYQQAIQGWGFPSCCWRNIVHPCHCKPLRSVCFPGYAMENSLGKWTGTRHAEIIAPKRLTSAPRRHRFRNSFRINIERYLHPIHPGNTLTRHTDTKLTPFVANQHLHCVKLSRSTLRLSTVTPLTPPLRNPALQT